LLAHGRRFSPTSFTTKTGHHDIAEILLKVALNTNNQIKSGGLYDVKRHAKGEIHNKAVEAQKTTKPMGCFFKKPNDKFDSQLIMAETLFSNFVAEHNLPFVAAQKVMEIVNVFSRCLKNFKVNEIVVSLRYKYPILGNLTQSQKYGLKW
jgi:UDP-N-acetylenolpyruvoylglucosamine reductase